MLLRAERMYSRACCLCRILPVKIKLFSEDSCAVVCVTVVWTLQLDSPKVVSGYGNGRKVLIVTVFFLVSLPYLDLQIDAKWKEGHFWSVIVWLLSCHFVIVMCSTDPSPLKKNEHCFPLKMRWVTFISFSKGYLCSARGEGNSLH